MTPTVWFGSLPRLAASASPVYRHVRQEQIAAGETTRNIVENPSVPEQVIVQKNSELQVLERILEQIVETIKEVPQERVQQRIVEQMVRVQSLRYRNKCSCRKFHGLMCGADSGTNCGVPVPQIQESIVEHFPERTVEQIENIPVPQAVGSESVEHVQQHTVEQIEHADPVKKNFKQWLNLPRFLVPQI